MDAYKTLAYTLITYRQFYGNAFLNRVQHPTFRLVTCTHKCEHVTPVLNSLHWLQVLYRTRSWFMNRKPCMRLSLGTQTDLIVANQQHEHVVLTYGTRNFGKAAATTWNSLPINITKFKTLGCFQEEGEDKRFDFSFSHITIQQFCCYCFVKSFRVIFRLHNVLNKCVSYYLKTF